MQIYLKYLVATVLLSTLIYADDAVVNNRKHSVRKTIDTVGKLETKSISIVDSFKKMFSDGKVSGQVRVVSLGLDPKESTQSATYATALGGILKYELAGFQGFNAGVAVYTSHDINGLTGENNKHNNDLSSSKGNYTEIAESYLNYQYENFNARVGRQILDTPLADSDDIRMISNTFNAAVISYNYQGFDFLAGNIDSWNGTDAGLDDGWSKVGSNGANFGGVTYADTLELSAWYYNITAQTNAAYIEFGGLFDATSSLQLHLMLQYLNESELDNSGIGASIYGTSFEVISNYIAFSVAYNKSLKKSGLQSFSGSGGGTLFTSMDTMILDDIAQDREAQALTSSITYSIDNFGFLYAYGDFVGEKNSANVKAHIVEQDIGFEYNVNDEFLVSAIYVVSEDKESILKNANDWQRAQLLINYNF